MRTKNSIKTMITALASNAVAILINLIAQALFIKILGSEYLGLNSLFSNILSMLAIVELGIGSAIIFNLYKPIEEKDKETIKSLMIFYRKSYSIIGIIVLVIGLIIIPFLPFLIKEVTISINLNIIYILFLLDTVFSYFLSYKRSILYANQKSYIINIIHIIYLFCLNFFQILILFLTQNYYLYLVIKIVMRILENVAITIYANHLYPYILEKNVKPISKQIKTDIMKKVKALFFHKVGSFVVFGTDSLVISKYLGLTTVGLYSNYNLVINGINTVVNQIVSSTTASVGSMLVSETKEKQFSIFKKIRFINFWLACFSGTGLLVVMQTFISIWIGKKYLLSLTILIVLVINYYFSTTRSTYNAFKDAAGIYYEDRFIPIIESISNIILSIILVKLIGLAGVFIGTIISGMALWCYSYPKFVYKKIFKEKISNYYKETLAYFILFLLVSLTTYAISILISSKTLIIDLFLKLIIACIIPNLLMFIIFKKGENFQYCLSLFPKLKKAKLRRK